MKVLVIDIGGNSGEFLVHRIGGENLTELDRLPLGCRAGDNALAFRGSFLSGRGRPPEKRRAVTASSASSRRH